MADSKIENLTAGNPALSTDMIPISRSGSTFQVTAGSIAALSAAKTFVPDLAGSPPEYEYLTGYDAATGLFSAAAIPAGGGGVISVNGHVGAVVLTYTDVNAAPTANPTFTGTANFANISVSGTTSFTAGSIALAALATGTNTYVLTMVGGVPAWATASSGFTDPMSHVGDMIYWGASPAGPAALPIGTTGQVLTVVGGIPAWAPSSSGSGTVSSGTAGQVAIYAANGTTVSGFTTALFYPETYGALGDNFHDDTTAIQAAITAAGVSGGTVVLGAKIYKTTAGLTISTYDQGHGVSIIGVNNGASVINCNSASADILTVSGAVTYPHFSNVILQDFAIRRSVTPTGAAKGLKFSTVLQATVVRVWSWDSIYGYYQTGSANINYRASNYNTSLGGSFGTKMFGFYFDGAGAGENSSVVADCGAVNDSSVTATLRCGLGIGNADSGGGSEGSNIQDLQVDRFGVGGFDNGVMIVATTHGGGGSSGVNDDLHFTDCVFDQIHGSAYSFLNFYGSRASCEITGGYTQMASGNTNPCIDIEDSQGIVITAVDMNCCTASGAIGVKISGSNSTGNIVNGNMILVESAGTPVLLNACTGNIIVNNSICAYSGDGFTTALALTGASYNVINGNNISGYGTNGITLDATSTHNLGSNVVGTNVSTSFADLGTNNSVTVNTLNAPVAINAIGSGTAAYTAQLTDANQLVTMAATGATFTVPAHATVVYPIGTTLSVLQLGAGSAQIKLVGATNVTLNSPSLAGSPPAPYTRAQYSTVSMVLLSDDGTHTVWNVGGDLA